MKPRLLAIILLLALVAAPADIYSQKPRQRAKTTKSAKTRKATPKKKATAKPKAKASEGRQAKFTAAEQQQISVATPGLFDKQNPLRIDFTDPATDYSFPLPVGQARVVDNQSLEITTKPGDIVLAMFDGTVRLSRNLPKFGNVVVIRHDNGLETVYGHNSRNLVRVGQRVRAGQRVAIVGDEGGRCYCLFSIMVNGGRVNPTTLLATRSHQLLRQVVVVRKDGSRVSIQTEAAQPEQKVVAKTDTKKRAGSITSLDPDDEDADLLARNPAFHLDLKSITDEHWSYPLQGAHVISPYGGRGRRKHAGVDIKTRPNDKVLAAFDGVVTQSGPYYGYGNYIVIRHAYGFSTCYSHQSRNYVKKGDKVKAGQVIGLTGRTGRATTEHLHFEVRFKGRAINPSMLFDHVSHRLQAKVLTIGRNGTLK